VSTVAIIGAGPLGRWLALGAARAGFRVLLEDVMPGNLHHARESIRQQLSPEVLPAVGLVSTIEDAVRDADLVIDCVPDELESKLEILWLLDRMAPRARSSPRLPQISPSPTWPVAPTARKSAWLSKLRRRLWPPEPSRTLCSAQGHRRARRPWIWCAVSGGGWASTPP